MYFVDDTMHCDSPIIYQTEKLKEMVDNINVNSW